jgi:hypothetical protein
MYFAVWSEQATSQYTKCGYLNCRAKVIRKRALQYYLYFLSKAENSHVSYQELLSDFTFRVGTITLSHLLYCWKIQRMSLESINSLDLFALRSSVPTAWRNSNNAEIDAFLSESCKPPVEATNPDRTGLL